MGFKNHLVEFQKAAEQLDKKTLQQKGIDVAVGIVLHSVFLKLYKKAWATQSSDPATAESRLFFSVWLNDASIREKRIFYNIHALKLRKLNGYLIESRKFADAFRTSFAPFERQWPNASVAFGPLTLMQGWVNVDLESFQTEIVELANKFLEIEHLIDKTLLPFKK